MSVNSVKIKEKEEEKTVGEKLVERFEQIANAVKELLERGITNRLLVLYIQDKTKLPKRDINAVLDAVMDFLKEFEK